MAFHHVSDDTDPHQHDTVEDARQCEYWASDEARADAEAEADAELAYERHLETRDWAEQAAFEDYERRMGMVSFEVAYAAAMAAPTA